MHVGLLNTGVQQQVACQVGTCQLTCCQSSYQGSPRRLPGIATTHFGRPTFPRPPEQQPMARADLSWGQAAEQGHDLAGAAAGDAAPAVQGLGKVQPHRGLAGLEQVAYPLEAEGLDRVRLCSTQRGMLSVTCRCQTCKCLQPLGIPAGAQGLTSCRHDRTLPSSCPSVAVCRVERRQASALVPGGCTVRGCADT